jgi:hypothetical protein
MATSSTERRYGEIRQMIARIANQRGKNSATLLSGSPWSSPPWFHHRRLLTVSPMNGRASTVPDSKSRTCNPLTARQSLLSLKSPQLPPRKLFLRSLPRYSMRPKNANSKTPWTLPPLISPWIVRISTHGYL